MTLSQGTLREKPECERHFMARSTACQRVQMTESAHILVRTFHFEHIFIESRQLIISVRTQTLHIVKIALCPLPKIYATSNQFWCARLREFESFQQKQSSKSDDDRTLGCE
jgi:hypothetical protein